MKYHGAWEHRKTRTYLIVYLISILLRTLLHISIFVLFGGRSGDLFSFSDECRLELFNLLIILDYLSLNLRHDILTGQGDVLLRSVDVIEWVWLFSLEWCAGNFRSTLHF